MKTLNSHEVVKAVFQKWISIFGPPNVIHSDQGPNLNSALMKQLCDNFGIRKTKTAPYHPQSNGQCERLFRTVKNMIYCGREENNKNWTEQLPSIEMILRGTYAASIGCSPFEIVFGKRMILSNFNEAFKGNNKWIPNYDILAKNLIPSDENIEDNFHIKRLKKGDYIMIRILPAVKGVYKPRFDGPFQIIKVSSSGNFIVVQGRNNEMIERNISDVKKAFKPIQRKMTYNQWKGMKKRKKNRSYIQIKINQDTQQVNIRSPIVMVFQSRGKEIV